MERSPRAAWLLPCCVAACALLIRIGWLVSHARPLGSDELDYDTLGWTLARTGTYALGAAPTAYRAIGYPAFVAGVYELFGRAPAAVKFLQALCDSGTAFLLVVLLQRRSVAAALLAGVAWAVLPAAVLFANQMFSESVFVFGLMAMTAILFADRQNRRIVAGLAALLAGLLILVRPAILPFVAAVPFVASRGRRAILLFCLCASVPPGVWIARNALVMHRPVLTTSTGANLLVGNGPGATGGYRSLPAPTTPDAAEVASDSAALHAAMTFVAQHPARASWIAARKVVYLLTSEAELAVGHFSSKAGDPAARFREKLAVVPAWVRLFVSLPTGLIIVFGTLGLATREQDLIGRIFYALLATTLVAAVVFFGSSRFRFPLLPYLTLFGAEFAVDLSGRLRAAQRSRLLVAVAICSAVALVWLGEIYMGAA